MATTDPDAPISEFAISYLSHHHEQICMALTDRPVDPNAIIPPSFFDAERVIPLLQSSAHKNNEHKAARDSHSAHTHTDEQTQLSAIKPISASSAKLALIETFRDVGLADALFAALIMPLLFTFTHSAGKMERHACLVAVTRLLHRYPELSAYLQPDAAS